MFPVGMAKLLRQMNSALRINNRFKFYGFHSVTS
jgi:hypothetical protein